MTAPRCWVMTEGAAGMENQCLGLAEALGLTPVVKRVRLRTPWHQATPWLPVLLPGALHPDSDPLAEPWPDLVIGCGRQATGPALAIRRASAGRTVLVHIQNPNTRFSAFDCVVMPEHDRKPGPNVIECLGSLTRITPDRLETAARRWAPAFTGLPRPLVAVLVGGSNRAYTLTPAIMAGVADRLAAWASGQGVGLLVTTSRRTGAGNAAILADRLAPLLAGGRAFLWDGTGDNPYFGFLALADLIVVTGDSVNMMSEAASSGRPLAVIELEGRSGKFDRFRNALYQRGLARPFTGGFQPWTPPRLAETARVAARLRPLLAARGLALPDISP